MSSELPVDVMMWLREFRLRILNLLLAITVGLGAVGILVSFYQHIQTGHLTFLLVYYLASYLVVLVLAFARQIPIHLRTFGFLTLLYVFAVLTFISGWLGGSGRQFLLAFIVLAAILSGQRAGGIAVVLSLGTFATFGLVYAQGWLIYDFAPAFSDPLIILVEGIGFAMTVGMIGIALWFFKEGLAAATQVIIESYEARQQLVDRAQELDRTNQLLAERTQHLEAANQELESFSYSVSHDLRTPLRAIDGYSRILQLEYSDLLASDAAHFLDIIRERTQYIGQLIDGLLSFSRLSRRPLNKQVVSSWELVSQALQNLDSELHPEGREINVVFGDLPECNCDPMLLVQVWINLITNAIKFSQERQDARIEIGCNQEKRVRVYYVKDNGVGFDQQYEGKLFGVFQRLHDNQGYEGTGVGLAIVQRIIHRHGGKIWAKGLVGQGAAFFFTLGPEDRLGNGAAYSESASRVVGSETSRG